MRSSVLLRVRAGTVWRKGRLVLVQGQMQIFEGAFSFGGSELCRHHFPYFLESFLSRNTWKPSLVEMGLTHSSRPCFPRWGGLSPATWLPPLPCGIKRCRTLCSSLNSYKLSCCKGRASAWHFLLQGVAVAVLTGAVCQAC